MTFTVKISTEIKSKYDPGDIVCFKLFSDEFYIGIIKSCNVYTYEEDNNTKAKIKYDILTYSDINYRHIQVVEEDDIVAGSKRETFEYVEKEYTLIFKEEN